MADINSTNLSTEAPDFSMLALFMQADLVVKSVIIILILASLYSWNVIISKILRIRQLKKLEKEFEDIFWSGNSFEDLYETLNFNQTDPKSKLFCAAILEWKKRERDVANYFNGKRTPLSGGNGKVTRADVIHEDLFIECKLRAKHTAISLWDDTAKLAKEEGKTPVIALCEKNRPGFWVMVHSSDLEKIKK